MTKYDVRAILLIYLAGEAYSASVKLPKETCVQGVNRAGCGRPTDDRVITLEDVDAKTSVAGGTDRAAREIKCVYNPMHGVVCGKEEPTILADRRHEQLPPPTGDQYEPPAGVPLSQLIPDAITAYNSAITPGYRTQPQTGPHTEFASPPLPKHAPSVGIYPPSVATMPSSNSKMDQPVLPLNLNVLFAPANPLLKPTTLPPPTASTIYPPTYAGKQNTTAPAHVNKEQKAKKNGDIIFTGPMMFTAPLHAQSAEIAKLYHGVNISQLVLQAGSPVELKEFRQASEQLQRTASRAVLSLKSHAFYLNTFRLAETFDEAKCILPLTAPNDSIAQLIVVHSSNDEDVISQFIYDDSLETIVPIQRPKPFPSSAYLMQPILWQKCNALYWEDELNIPTEKALFSGRIVALNPDGVLNWVKGLRSPNKAEWAYSLNLGGRSCLIRGAHRYGAILELFCSDTDDDYALVQTLDIPSPTQAAHLLVNGEDHVFVTCNSDEYTEGTVAVLRWDSNTGTLKLIQTFLVVNATAVDAISYSGAHFVAVASGRLDMKPHPGMVDISRYDPLLRSYNHWLSLEVEAPTLVKFAILPSDELVLYVLTEQPTKSFVAFLYRGLAGFQEHTSLALSLGDTLTVMQTVGYRHLVSVSNTHGGKAVLLRANFKGVKYNNNVKSI